MFQEGIDKLTSNYGYTKIEIKNKYKNPSAKKGIRFDIVKYVEESTKDAALCDEADESAQCVVNSDLMCRHKNLYPNAKKYVRIDPSTWSLIKEYAPQCKEFPCVMGVGFVSSARLVRPLVRRLGFFLRIAL